MQLATNENINPPAPTALDAKIADAEAEHLALQEAAAKAEETAEAAEVAFQKEPTATAHADAAVTRQRATNADRLVAEHRSRVLTPLVEERAERLREAERAEIRKEVDIALVQRQLDRIRSAVAMVATEFDEATAELAKLLLVRHRHLHGRGGALGVQINPVNFEREIELMNAQLQELAGSDWQNGISLRVLDSGKLLKLDINRPCASVPRYT